jgi:transcription antitermination factor NusA-like protein
MPDFENDQEEKGYLRGVEDTVKKMQKPPLTLADIRQMSTKEIMARKREVDKVLAEPNRASDDDD